MEILEIVLELLKSALLWIVLFVVGFAAVMLAIVAVVKVAGRLRKKPPVGPAPPEFVETPGHVEQICALLRLLADNDARLTQALPLFARDKAAFAQKYLPDPPDDVGEYSYWLLMIHTLAAFGYLSYNDWKFPMAEALGNLWPALEHYGIDPALYDAVPGQYEIMEPEASRRIAAGLPAGYALLSLDTGEDSYALAVAPEAVAQQTLRLAAEMERPSYITGISRVAGTADP